LRPICGSNLETQLFFINRSHIDVSFIAQQGQ